jgi:hypothetical protein
MIAELQSNIFLKGCRITTEDSKKGCGITTDSSLQIENFISAIFGILLAME